VSAVSLDWPVTMVRGGAKEDRRSSPKASAADLQREFGKTLKRLSLTCPRGQPRHPGNFRRYFDNRL